MDFLSSVTSFTSSYSEDDDSANVILVDQNSNSIISDIELSAKNMTSTVLYNFSPEPFDNFTISPDILNATVKNEGGFRDPLTIILPISFFYLIIFVTGILGNVITCVVIANNKTMHTATNYYLFNLAVSDFLVLIFGMPFDFLNIWLPNSYPFDEIVCIIQGLLSETSTNATILTITSFTCERYIAICHPFRSHTMSKLSRVVKFIFAIWILAFTLAAPQAFQYGTVASQGGVSCTVKNQFIEHAFEVSSFLFFIVPMTLICLLYILIGLKLRQSKLLYGKKMKTCDTQRYIKGQSRVIRMLIAVVVTFFLCWAPFHAQRIMAVYGKVTKKPFSSDDMFVRVYIVLTYISGITYFLSTCINPFLYNIMSHKFRNASKLTLFVHCLSRTPSTRKSQLGSNYSALTLKFGGMEPARMTTFNGNHYMLPQQTTSEIIQIKDDRHIDEVRNFACRAENVSPFMMDQSYQSVVKLASSYEPINFSCSQTTTTTLSRENSAKKKCINHKGRICLNGNLLATHMNDNRRNSFAEKLKRCTQKVLTFTSDVSTPSSTTTVEASTMKMAVVDDIAKIKKRVSSDSIKSGNTISDSSLKEIDEEEFTSSEFAQMMYELKKEIKHSPSSWWVTTSV